MYSGTTLTPFSGKIIGAHQKIDRIARRHLNTIIDDSNLFPKSKNIIHFEGRKGPDAIKRKSPSKDEPWHFYSPFDEQDSAIISLISEHYNQLVIELKNKNQERSAFEASWLAHAVVDGLTPAHHYPYEKELSEIRGGEDKSTRDSLRKKMVVSGNNRREKLHKNWKIWGPKGLISTHALFELGVATIIAPLKLKDAKPKESDIRFAQENGAIELFQLSAKEIAVLDMYTRFRKRGWNTKLVWDVRHKLGPTIVKTVTLTWYLAMIDAGIIQDKDYLKNYENMHN